MKVLHVASEGAPFVKTGGLADVIGALPLELSRQEVDVRVIMPKYSKIPEHYRQRMTVKEIIHVSVGWRKQYCGIEVLEENGITYYFLDNEYYFKRDGNLYGFYDEAERFAFFARAVLQALPHLDFRPDVLHCHDWQAGLVPFLLKVEFQHDPFYQGIKSVYTIHNLLYQGVFPSSVLGELIGLGDDHLSEDGIGYFDAVNYMKGGLNFADKVTTVSQTYAREIQTEYFGATLEGLLRKRNEDLVGIVNGIDYESYDPAADPHLYELFSDTSASSVQEILRAKEQNKVRLQEELGLPIREDAPMIAVISRFVEQKGFDLILHVLQDILQLDAQLIILGTGDAQYEQAFREAAWYHPHKVSAQITFDEGFARRLYAASDLFLMPSKFEPCGLSQLLALRYGSVPIVRETGGLADTVQAYDEITGTGNGFSFTNYNAHDMLHTIHRAVTLWHDRDTWAQILENGRLCDFSWTESAKQYRELYQQV
ncbi:glycogen synthase GlgA [Tumebacillus permanentifrigoris]|uniref:Glycogen synthase n=1 Tax=Tumebacillus permanentifrigoris TaxID=378543 RepID=A0A316D5U0_9BACL|nr:glycogen synthase GlgA [Tumebacillus permanentifrigoris]PWK09031.1 starch synthase [Tumebacillus permanentifrigoris]